MHPNNWLIPEHRLIVFGTPKCASSSLKKAFAIALGIIPAGTVGLPTGIVNPELRFVSPQKALALRQVGWRGLAVSRDPYSRFLSLWNERINGRERGVLNRNLPGGLTQTEFAQWLAEHGDDEIDHHAATQASAVCVAGVPVPDVVLRFEELDAEWARFCSEFPRIGLSALDHVRNGSRKRKKRPPQPFDPAARHLIAARYAADFELFGYTP